ncbi:NUDIX hydrolase [Ferroplasma acidiphilum]|uniref:MutT family protein n=2 Tax=Ferroplasma TaxID=74968 RepID=S0ATJ9_FERAC|nr:MULTISPECIES: NUDIX hydrolase [Ferroplasma]AGO61445.1 MutT family protein [Ferroplasma acidarmanus Fer1]NOL59966.1 NUDIX hydrolase [Ferroplasma acidiphilum]
MKTYPKVAVGGVITLGNKILLGKRRDEPDRYKWAIPGGKLELNETIEEGLKREMLEETGLTVEVENLLGISEIIRKDFHYIILDYKCRPVKGIEHAGSDALRLKYFDMESLDNSINESTMEFIKEMKKSTNFIHIIKKDID